MADNLTRKILAAHLVEGNTMPGEEIGVRIDQCLIQDITGTVVMLNFEAMEIPRIACEVACAYADHNVLQVDPRNQQDHIYLSSAARKYGIWWAKPGAGIGHQVHLEHFAVPGKTALGADSHTQHCGGVGMIAIGAGGLDVAAALGGGSYHLLMPQVVSVRLTGSLRPWSTAKDVILELLRRLTVRGGYGKVMEFTGPGVKSLNVAQRVTITNMCTELGATTGIFPSDEITLDYFRRIGREGDWRPAAPDPDATYDGEIELDLSSVVPLVAKPSQPDNVVPIEEVEGTPLRQVIIGSCTNGHYTDLQAAARILKGRKVSPDLDLIIHPSSRLDLNLLSREGLLSDLIDAGATIGEPTCGPCIGIGHVPAGGTNSLRAMNRNFSGRSGLSGDSVYLSSVEVAAASAIAGCIADPRKLDMDAPEPRLPQAIPQENPNLVSPAPVEEAAGLAVIRGENIRPVPAKQPLEASLAGEVLIKVGDDISTDVIMPAGAQILAFRSNIPRISEFVFHRLDPTFSTRAVAAGGGFIVGGLNYGQGSSREHAALAPMYLGVKGVIAKSFARIHLANLINWGLLPMVFDNPNDYDLLQQGDRIEVPDVRAQIESGEDHLTVKHLPTGREVGVHIQVTPRQRRYLLAGGRLSEIRQRHLVGV